MSNKNTTIVQDVNQSSSRVGASLENVPFQKLDFGETAILDLFYNADVVIVDMTIATQQSSLFYHIGVRQSMSMKNNIVIANDIDPEGTVSLKVSVFFLFQDEFVLLARNAFTLLSHIEGFHFDSKTEM